MVWYLFLACTMVVNHFGSAADPSDSEIIFEVPKGITARARAKSGQGKVIDNADNFQICSIDKEETVSNWKIPLNRAMTDKCWILCGTLHNDKPFAVLEGWRIREIDAALAKEGWIKAGEYATLANSPKLFTAPFDLPKDTLEGYLYPETYMLTPDRFDPKEFIQRQLDLLADNFYTPNKAAIQQRTFFFRHYDRCQYG